VIVAEDVSALSATDVAVMVAVCAALVAAGAVYVTEVVDWPDRAPGPLNAQLTPPEFLSLLTVAVKVTVSVPSTVDAAVLIATLIGFDFPPHPFTQISARTARTPNPSLFPSITAPRCAKHNIFCIVESRYCANNRSVKRRCATEINRNHSEIPQKSHIES
jgi:hypothetical protein